MKPIDPEDFKRVESLHQLHILDIPRQASFDRITQLCADVFDCSISLVSLVDEQRQWFLSSVGLEVRETPREISFCDHAIDAGCSLLIPDALKDERFFNNPLVRDTPAIRSYLGAPVKSPDGAFIGTLCIADQRENLFDQSHIAKLEMLAATVEDLIRAHSQAAATGYLNFQLDARSSRLNRANRVFKQAEKIAKIGSWEWNIETHELSWSDEAFAIFGSPEIRPTSIEETFLYYDAEDQQKVSESVKNISSHQESFEFEAGLNAADGVFKRVKAMGEYLAADQQGPARLVGIIQDITESHHTRLALERAADRDSLTDLYNRNALDRFLQTTLGKLKQTGSNAFLLMLDLDGFKDINDTFGHLIGDVFLEKISSRIVDTLPRGAIVARWGGDEFIILTAPDISLQAARQLGDDILVSVERQIEISGRKMGVSATCGLVEIGAHSIAREIIRMADLALYYGKEREPGRVHVYVPELEQANQHRQEAIAKVREALDRDCIFAGYQPIVDLRTHQLVGLEALMRLSVSNGEQITASDVLPAILDPILSREIGERMLSSVCRDLDAIERAHRDIQFVSINATEADLLSRDFADNLLSKLAEAKINPAKITLEVTETMLMVNDTNTVQNVLAQLSASGMRIALDDFGTGFSSLSHLRDFPIDSVKIDKSFIKSITAEHQSRLIVQALINMASNLGIEVIAEGVETEAQRNLLLQLGCNLGQGFLISPAQSLRHIRLMRFPGTLAEPEGNKKVA